MENDDATKGNERRFYAKKHKFLVLNSRKSFVFISCANTNDHWVVSNEPEVNETYSSLVPFLLLLFENIFQFHRRMTKWCLCVQRPRNKTGKNYALKLKQWEQNESENEWITKSL